jgi:hypothetical protein
MDDIRMAHKLIGTGGIRKVADVEIEDQEGKES